MVIANHGHELSAEYGAASPGDPGEHASRTASAVELRCEIVPVAGMRTCSPLMRTAPRECDGHPTLA